MTNSKTPNRLINEKSPYLLQHAYNPVDWYPWGEEAFQKAKNEDKPIFLSVGYSTCYWCHVMEREVFENETIANLMNQLVVSIKVDREERPDIDRIYMNALQIMTDQGGWPMSVFLTPDLKPFFGATYIPPTPRYGRPGFVDILNGINNIWKNERDKIIDSSNKIVNYLQSIPLPLEADRFPSSLIDETFKNFERNYNKEFGGFGTAPKFPRPVIFNFLLRYYKTTGNKNALTMTLSTLQAIARGGIYDQLEGGFHRYSVDNQWRIPHFEKMLYDQAQLIVNYLEAYQITKEIIYLDIADQTLHYVSRKLSHPSGGFYTSEIFCFFYGIEDLGNAIHDPLNIFYGKNVLYQSRTIDETAKHFSRTPENIINILSEARKKLKKAREKRIPPMMDDKILTSWNGLMISAFAKGYKITDKIEYLEKAENAVSFILEKLYDQKTGILYHRYRDGKTDYQGTLQDYAFFIQGLIDLYEASIDINYLKLAEILTEKQIDIFLDSTHGGFYDTTADDNSLILRTKEYYDGAEPSGNSVSVINLIRLSNILKNPKLHNIAIKTIESLGINLTENPAGMVQLLTGYQWSQMAPSHLILYGTDCKYFIKEINSHFLPFYVIININNEGTNKYFSVHIPFIENFQELNNKCTAYICKNFTCKLPITDLAELKKALDDIN